MEHHLDERSLRRGTRRFFLLVDLVVSVQLLLVLKLKMATIRCTVAVRFLESWPALESFAADKVLAGERDACRRLDTGLRAKEGREAADAHDEGEGEQAELVAGGRGTRVALENEGDLGLLLARVARNARRWRSRIDLSELVGDGPSLLSDLLATDD